MVRDKAWLKAVSSLDCQRCGMSGQTQAAHANWSKYGKGMGMKAHDCFVAALCQTCHFAIDQGAKMTAEERVDEWEAAGKRLAWRSFPRIFTGVNYLFG